MAKQENDPIPMDIEEDPYDMFKRIAPEQELWRQHEDEMERIRAAAWEESAQRRWSERREGPPPWQQRPDSPNTRRWRENIRNFAAGQAIRRNLPNILAYDLEDTE